METHTGATTSALALAGLLVILGGAPGETGCSPATRHRILATVFDGVPEPDTSQALVAAAAADSAVVSPPPPEEETVRPSLVIHPPFGRRECDTCHLLENRGRFTGEASLAAPQRELCASCHEHMSFASLRSRYGWIHGPVAAGACTGCHTPHRSLHEHLLLEEPGGKLCLRCHDAARLASTETHEDAGTDCLDCHEAHGEVEPW